MTTRNAIRWRVLLFAVPLLAASAWVGASAGEPITASLETELQPRAVTTHQLTQYLARRIPPLPVPTSAAKWTAHARRMRQKVLQEIVFHGWPRDWVTAAPRVEDLGVLTTTADYRVRKLRYEIVPGFHAPAILCEPVQLTTARAPAVLNFIGHEEHGKAVEHAQRRCMGLAAMGIVTLTPEWPGLGELAGRENAHDVAAHLDLVGANSLGFFYLAMRKALDHLAQLPLVDATRIGATGLSGGGWQSVVLGALDERVGVVVEVAGIGALQTTLTHPSETDEIEENATDLGRMLDYPELLALRAPRPTLLIHNANDECCFRAGLVKPFLYDALRPFWAPYGRTEHLAWHENVMPGTHNYDRDNRRAAYRFFAQHFGLGAADADVAESAALPEASELNVGVSANNETLLGVARTLAARVRRAAMSAPAAERAKLADVLRYQRGTVVRGWPMWSTRTDRGDALSYRLELSDGLGASAVWLRPRNGGADAPLTIVLHDDGRAAAAPLAAERLGQGEQVLALDPLFFGDMVPEQPVSPGAELGVDVTVRPQKTGANYQMLVATLGARPLGIQASQLLAVARWAKTMVGPAAIRVHTTGMRSQLVALAAAALEPGTLSSVISRQAMPSLRHLLDAGVPYRAAPELFCLDLYARFDIDRLTTLAEPTSIRREGDQP